MHLTRLVVLIVAGSCWAVSQTLHAQATAPPPTPAPTTTAAPSWTPDKQFSADEVVTLKSGMTVSGKAYMDNGKMRTEMSMNGMNMVAIIRTDEKKMYTVMPAQKMVMEMPLNPDKVKQYAALASGADSKFDLVGPEVAEGAACLKYKMTSTTNTQVFYWWVNAATKFPVKFASDDGAVTTTFANYKPGPQDPALFEPPAGFQVMQMPAGMGAPGGGAPAGP